MQNKSRFQRIFFIFKQEDTGYGAGQEPSGYVKVEVRGEKGKLQAEVHNLKEGQDKFIYRLYLLKRDSGGIVPALVGSIATNQNKGEIKWEFDPDNVENTGCRVQDFNVAALLAENKNGENTQIICPIAAYKDKKVDWREELRKALNHARSNSGQENVEKVNSEAASEEDAFVKREDILSKYRINVESKYPPEKDEPVEEQSEVKDEGMQNHEPGEYYVGDLEEARDENSLSDEGGSSCETVHRKEESAEEDRSYTSENIGSAEDSSEAGPSNNSIENKPQPYSEPPRTNTNCMFRSNNNCGMQFYDSSTYPCASCYLNNGIKTDAGYAGNGNTDIERLKASFEKHFQGYNPFRTKRRDYKWWKVNSPVHLNNIFYQSNIRTPLLFNPAVIMAHFKYRHLIVGIYTDRGRRREYIVCGVPAVYNIDEKPFGDMCRWVQLEGLTPRYGAFGYWLVYIDSHSGRLLNVN